MKRLELIKRARWLSLHNWLTRDEEHALVWNLYQLPPVARFFE